MTLVGYGTETLASGKTADYWIIKNRQGWRPVSWLLSLAWQPCCVLHQLARLCAVVLTCRSCPACPTGSTLVQLGCELGGAGLRAPAQAGLAGRPCGHLLGGHLLRLPPHRQRQYVGVGVQCMVAWRGVLGV